jgi:hypothetical protein
MPAVQSAALAAVRPQEIGKASGTYNAMRQLGGALGIAVLSAVFSARGGFSTPHAVTTGFSDAMVAACGLSALGALAGLGLGARRRPDYKTSSPEVTTMERTSA